MGECGLRGGYAEIINLDPAVKAMYLKSISAKLCPTTLGQVRYTWIFMSLLYLWPEAPLWCTFFLLVLGGLKNFMRMFQAHELFYF